jgi:hypothetical protein
MQLIFCNSRPNVSEVKTHFINEKHFQRKDLPKLLLKQRASVCVCVCVRCKKHMIAGRLRRVYFPSWQAKIVKSRLYVLLAINGLLFQRLYYFMNWC